MEQRKHTDCRTDLEKPKRGATEVAASLTVEDIGWDRDQALRVRARLGTFAADWDDPSMDVYDDL